jgi:hypothetical protein
VTFGESAAAANRGYHGVDAVKAIQAETDSAASGSAVITSSAMLRMELGSQ